MHKNSAAAGVSFFIRKMSPTHIIRHPPNASAAMPPVFFRTLSHRFRDNAARLSIFFSHKISRRRATRRAF
jgi:hypothetical protein